MKARNDPNGIHLFDRKSGWNILIDEVNTSASKYSLAPRQVSIALTNICDLKCEFCYAPKNNAFLEFDTLKKWLKELDNNGALGVGFGGGEPTLHKQFVDICNFIHEETSLATTFTTHGHHINDKLLKKIENSVQYIRFSMDGVYETYESLRKRSFSSFLGALSRVRNTIPFGINYVVNDYTSSQLSSAVSIVEEHGGRELLLLPQRQTSKVANISSIAEMHLQEFIENYKGPVRLSIGSDINSIPTCNPFSNYRDDIYDYAHIDALGNLKYNSFDLFGVKIKSKGVIPTITDLLKMKKLNENME